MKLFFYILFAAVIIGGFAGGEVLDTSFSILGAVIGGVGTAAVLLGLGAYFDSQDKKSSALSPEMRGVFDRMITGKQNPTSQEVKTAKQRHHNIAQPRSGPSKRNNKFSLEGTMQSLMAQDAEAFARGEVPEKRLIPHHAIKRDLIVAAYTKDLHVAIKHINDLDWSESEKQKTLSQIHPDFDKKIYGIKRLGWEDLDKIIALMKKTRTDFLEIETEVRSKNTMYEMVDPL